MSWNIQQLSVKHAVKDLLMGVEVRAWIAKLLHDMQANLLGVMELTTGHGSKACELLKDSCNVVAKGTYWDVWVSDKNTTTSKADKYGLLWVSSSFTYDNDKFAAISITGQAIEKGTGINWASNRLPLFWQTVSAGTTVNCMLWHAPQPKDHQKRVTIGNLAMLAGQFQTANQIDKWVISGDFNFDTASTVVYQDLANASFIGIFDGELTTLTTLKSFIDNNKEKFVTSGQYDAAYLASAYDNVFYKGVSAANELKVMVPTLVLNEIMTSVKFQIVTRSKAAEALVQARKISDHLPLVTTMST
jgi:endonuclease/exonuclease/phosphatase family metal-dependent hydrolase